MIVMYQALFAVSIIISAVFLIIFIRSDDMTALWLVAYYFILCLVWSDRIDYHVDDGPQSVAARGSKKFLEENMTN